MKATIDRPGPGPDALEASAARAFRLPVSALLGTLALLVLAVLVSAGQGAAGLPVEGIVRSLAGALPGLDVAQQAEPAGGPPE